MMGRQAGG